MKTLAIYYIATSNYKMGFTHFKQNIHHFFPQFKKTVVVLSDGLDEWNNVEENGITYKVHHIHHFVWPIIALFKMTLIRDFWEDCDYACYFNADMQCNKDYDYLNSNYDFDKLNCAFHVTGTDCAFDGKDFENVSKDSVAYIKELYKYIHGGYFFGPSIIVKEMCNAVSNMVEEDLKKNIIPQWHDESYLNKWCVLNKDKVNKQRFVFCGKFNENCSIATIGGTIDKDRRTNKRYFEKKTSECISDKRYIFIDSNDGRFANQLFPIFKALTIFEKGGFEKIYFKNYWEYHDQRRLSDENIQRLPQSLHKIICFDNKEYDEMYLSYANSSELITGYCQDLKDIDIDVVHKYFECPIEIKSKIHELYGDMSKLVCIHVRRGDFFRDCYKDKFISLNKEYIEKCIEKYFNNERFIVISDDIEWCKQNLSNYNIVFADKCDDILVDFYIQTLTKGNICSPSSFSIAGSIINSHRKMIVPYPFFKQDVPDINLYPSWCEKELIEF